MSNVVEFKKLGSQTIHGEAICIGCKHEWEASAPVGTYELDCPECHGNKAIFKHSVTRIEEHFKCNCSSFLFSVTRNGIYCINCGNWVTPYE